MRRPPLLPLLMLALAAAPALARADDAAPRFGLSAAAGVPDGAAVNGVFRPVDPLRLSGGLTWNWFGFGVQAGADLVPFHWPVSPTLSLEYGHYFPSDMRWVASQSAGVPTQLKPLMKDLGYDYASAQVGLEVGASDRVVVFLRAGLSWLWATAHGSATTNTTSGSQQVMVTVTDPSIRATIPSLKLGVLFYL